MIPWIDEYLRWWTINLMKNCVSKSFFQFFLEGVSPWVDVTGFWCSSRSMIPEVDETLGWRILRMMNPWVDESWIDKSLGRKTNGLVNIENDESLG